MDRLCERERERLTTNVNDTWSILESKAIKDENNV